MRLRLSSTSDCSSSERANMFIRWPCCIFKDGCLLDLELRWSRSRSLIASLASLLRSSPMIRWRLGLGRLLDALLCSWLQQPVGCSEAPRQRSLSIAGLRRCAPDAPYDDSRKKLLCRLPLCRPRDRRLLSDCPVFLEVHHCITEVLRGPIAPWAGGCGARLSVEHVVMKLEHNSEGNRHIWIKFRANGQDVLDSVMVGPCGVRETPPLAV